MFMSHNSGTPIPSHGSRRSFRLQVLCLNQTSLYKIRYIPYTVCPVANIQYYLCTADNIPCLLCTVRNIPYCADSVPSISYSVTSVNNDPYFVRSEGIFRVLEVL
jgi:hypothetical protein